MFTIKHDCEVFQDYRLLSRDVMAAILVSRDYDVVDRSVYQTNPDEVEPFARINTFQLYLWGW